MIVRVGRTASPQAPLLGPSNVPDHPAQLSLERALDVLADDELPEVTPQGWRLRKRLLT